MSKLGEFQNENEDLIVTRVVTLIHRLVDQEFPRAKPAPKRFAKTLFSEGDEPTINQAVPGEFRDFGQTPAEPSHKPDLLAPKPLAKASTTKGFTPLFILALIFFSLLIFALLRHLRFF